MTDAFFVLTDPDSSIVKPAAIHMTSPPQMRNENVLKMNWTSSLTMFPAPSSPAAPVAPAPEATRGCWGGRPPESQRAERARVRPAR